MPRTIPPTLIAPLAPASLKRMRLHLRAYLPASRLSHIGEALAVSMGFNTAIALRDASRRALPGAFAYISCERFESRLGDFHPLSLPVILLGYSLGQGVWLACSYESYTPEGRQAEFMRLVARAMGAGMHKMLVTSLPTAQLGTEGIATRENMDSPGPDSGSPFMQVEPSVMPRLMEAAQNMGEDRDGKGILITHDRAALPSGLDAVLVTVSEEVGTKRPLMILLHLRRTSTTDALKVLDLTPTQLRDVESMCREPFGVTLVSGKGSEETSDALMRFTMSEMDPGATKVYVDDGSMKDRTLRQVLGSDPDVVMAGCIDGKERASLAFAAAMTGHRVISSMKAEHTFTMLDMLTDMGVDSYKATDHPLLTGLISQRLLPRLCTHCSLSWTNALRVRADAVQAVHGLSKRLQAADRVIIRVADTNGCKACTKGVNGSELVAEVIRPDAAFMTLARTGDRQAMLADWLGRLGGMTLLEHALVRMLQGRVDPSDVLCKVGNFSNLSADSLGRVTALLRKVYAEGKSFMV